MQPSWNKRIALVTGATAGIGAAVCKKLVDRGLIVIGCARNTDKIEALFPENQVKKNGGKLHAIKCDLTQEYEFLNMFQEIRKKYGRLDLVVNNAGLSMTTEILELTGDIKDWRRMFRVSIPAMNLCNREAIELMREKEVQEGQIINISSLLPETTRKGIHYCGNTNIMVEYLTNKLRKEIMEQNNDKSHIRVANVFSGLVKTEFLSKMLGPETASTIYKSTPALKPEDIAEVVECILSTPPRVNLSDISVLPS